MNTRLKTSYSLNVLLAILLVAGAAWQALAGPSPVHAQQNAQTLTPVYEIQGAGASSPLVDARVNTVGVVTGLTPNGFYLQDATGDADPNTSDGLYVFTYSPPARTFPAVKLGACVAVYDALVQEYYGKTELSRVADVASAACTTNSPLPAHLPFLRLGEDAAGAYERFEGMLVAVDALDGVVHGPTKRYVSGEAEIALLPASLQPAVQAGRILRAGESATDTDMVPWAGDALVYLSSLLGGDLPEANRGDRIHSADAGPRVGVLDYNFGKYQLLLLPGQPLQVEASPYPAESGLAESADDFTVCTYNVHGLGRGEAQYPQQHEYEDAVNAAAGVIAGAMQGCTVLALQETGTPADAQNLAERLSHSHGLSYTAIAEAGPMTPDAEFPLTNSFLVRNDRVEIAGWHASQACTLHDYGVPLTSEIDCPAGQYPLFSRPPLVLDVRVAGTWGNPFSLRLVDNHWKSKAGDEDVNAVRRLQQAEHVAQIVQNSAQEAITNIIVLGDLNDFSDSAPLQRLAGSVSTTSPLLFDVWNLLTEADRYSYIFNGVSQVLDHILIAPNMVQFVSGADALHINADFAMCETARQGAPCQHSDHEPLVIRVKPDGAASLGGNLGYAGVEVEWVRAAGGPRHTTVTGADGGFRLWDLPAGVADVRIQLPDWLLLGDGTDALTLRIDLASGYNELPTPDVRLQPAKQAAQAAYAIVDAVTDGK